MRILHVTPSFYPATVYGGPTTIVYALCGALTRQGCDVRVLTTDANGPSDTLDMPTDRDVLLPNGVRTRYFPRQRPDSISAGLLAELPRAIRAADVVHLQAVYSFPTIPVLTLSALLQKPLVWTPHGALQRWEGSTRLRLKSAWEAVCRVVRPATTVLHLTSQQEADESASNFRGARSVIIANGIDVPELHTPAPKNETLELLFIGRIHPKKGIDNLLDACAKLTTPWHLTIAGSGQASYQRQLQARTATLGIDERVNFTGFLDEDGKRAAFAAADVTVIPSHTESFAMVVAESLAHAVPVIASHGTPWQQLDERGCGRWIANDPDTLARNITELATAPLSELGAQGRAWMKRDYSWDSVGAHMRALYRELID